MHDITRLVQIAMAVEPLPDKEGLTTRYKNIEETLKLEYFITGAINSGLAIDRLMERKEGEDCYDLLFKAYIDNHLNRGGLRVNEGMLQLFWPIILSIKKSPNLTDTTKILEGATKALMYTSTADSLYLQQAQNFGYSQWSGHFEKVKMISLELDSVYEYYANLFKEGSKVETRWGGEFIHKFPRVRYYLSLIDRDIPYSKAMEEVYRTLIKEDHFSPPGMMADFLAVATFLLMYAEDYKIR